MYDLVVKRFLAVFYPSAEFQQTTRITRVEGGKRSNPKAKAIRSNNRGVGGSSREGLVKTPHRAATAFGFLTSGYSLTVEDVLNQAVFQEDYGNMVIVKDIEFYSLCRHHLLPFFGKAYVAYIPDGKIVGLSRLPGWLICLPAGFKCRNGSPNRWPMRWNRRSIRLASRS